jgi:hypothetical protein
MASRSLRMICAGGDKTIAECDTETTTSKDLAEIKRVFDKKVGDVWFAADIADKRDVLIAEFDPKAEILLIPKLHGGSV